MTERVTTNPGIREREVFAESFLYRLEVKTTPELYRPTPYIGKVSGTVSSRYEVKELKIKVEPCKFCTLENGCTVCSPGCFLINK